MTQVKPLYVPFPYQDGADHTVILKALEARELAATQAHEYPSPNAA